MNPLRSHIVQITLAAAIGALLGIAVATVEQRIELSVRFVSYDETSRQWNVIETATIYESEDVTVLYMTDSVSAVKCWTITILPATQLIHCNS